MISSADELEISIQQTKDFLADEKDISIQLEIWFPSGHERDFHLVEKYVTGTIYCGRNKSRKHLKPEWKQQNFYLILDDLIELFQIE